jgi:hypothetical protein
VKWSFSQHNAFKRCQRQWYFRHIYASSIAKDEGRREAYRLSKLTNLKAWRGKIVDSIISNLVVPAIDRGLSIDLQAASKAAWNRFSQQQQLGLQSAKVDDGDFRGFLEVEHGSPPTQADFDNAWSDVELALRSFFDCFFARNAIEKASTCKTQRRIPFSCDGASLIAVPDVICFYTESAPLIIDWKVQTNPVGNYWLQLATYALAVTRCTPHRDWPSFPRSLVPTDIELAEIQLLTHTVRTHTVTSEEVEEIEESKDMRAEDFPTARSPGTCHYCSFKKLCWVMDS